MGGFRIDFVVEGEGDRRLAIELDGDRYHGPDRWADDLRRQRALERMGWTFWRCWGSHWVGDSQACMDDLLATLGRLGIEPVMGDRSPTEWTRHVVVGEERGEVPPPPEATVSDEEPGAVVRPGDEVEVRFADNGSRRAVVAAAGTSPLADALLGCAVDDEVTVEVDGKPRIAVVEAIRAAVPQAA